MQMHRYIVAEWGGVSGSSYQSVGNWGSVFILTLIIFSTCLFGKKSRKTRRCDWFRNTLELFTPVLNPDSIVNTDLPFSKWKI